MPLAVKIGIIILILFALWVLAVLRPALDWAIVGGRRGDDRTERSRRRQ